MQRLVFVFLLLTGCGIEATNITEADLAFRRAEWTTVHGRRVRALTTTERRRLGRPVSSYVVEDPAALDAMARGHDKIEIMIPSSARRGEVFVVRRSATVRSPFPFLHRDGRGRKGAHADSFRPSFNEYLTADANMRSRRSAVIKFVAEVGRPNSAMARGAVGMTAVEMRVVRPALLDPGMATGPALVFSFVALGQSAVDAQNQCNGSGTCGAYCHATDTNSVCDPDVWDHGCCQPWQPAGAVIPNECTDGIDNDGDGTTDFSDNACGHSDHCDAPGMPLHTHRYESGADVGLFGDIVLCTDFGDAWTTEFWERAHDMREIFHNVPGAPPTGDADFDAWAGFPGNAKPVRIAAVGCWTLDDLDDAKDCRSSGGAACAPFTAGGSHPYPYAGADDDVYSYVNGVKNDVLHGMNASGLDTPLHAAHVSVDLATFYSASGLAESTPGFASAGVWPGQPVVMAHEIGHTLGLDHCFRSVVESFANGTKRWSLMGDDGADFCEIPDGDQESDQLGASEAGALYENLREVMNEVDGQEQWLIHPPSFGNH